jgi:predicted RNA polymerase sigma factor
LATHHRLYDAVAQLAPSPVVELNAAVAVGMAFGPAAGLLWKLGRFQEAATSSTAPRR